MAPTSSSWICPRGLPAIESLLVSWQRLLLHADLTTVTLSPNFFWELDTGSTAQQNGEQFVRKSPNGVATAATDLTVEDTALNSIFRKCVSEGSRMELSERTVTPSAGAIRWERCVEPLGPGREWVLSKILPGL